MGQDDTRKAARVAGGAVIEDVMFSVPASLTRFAEINPLDDLEVATELSSVVARLDTVAAAP